MPDAEATERRKTDRVSPASSQNLHLVQETDVNQRTVYKQQGTVRTQEKSEMLQNVLSGMGNPV